MTAKPISIAVAGKGGTGKTTLAALIVRNLARSGKAPLLVVDADANANLAESLGLSSERSIGGILHQFQDERNSLPPGMTKEAFLDVRLNETLIESNGMDLLVMGRKEGPGCYCHPNAILRKFMDFLLPNYRFIIMDNEAGLEHLSRRTTDRVDVLLVVTDPSVKGARTAASIREIARELKLEIGRMALVVGRYVHNGDPAFEEALRNTGLEVAARIPYDDAVFQRDLAGESLMELPDDRPAVAAVAELLARLGLEKPE